MADDDGRDALESPAPGPVEAVSWPEQLEARVVDPGPPVRVQGYEVDADLACHYRYTEVVALLLGGELPAGPAARALDVALVLLAPMPVCEAPGHVGLLSRVCGTTFPSTLAIGALTLAEQAAVIIEEHVDWLAWLDRPEGPPPARHLASTDEEGAELQAVATALAPTGLAVPALAVRPRRVAALLGVLHACGLGRPETIATLLVVARLPAVAAEAAAAGRVRLQDYPLGLPPIQYVEAKR